MLGVFVASWAMFWSPISEVVSGRCQDHWIMLFRTGLSPCNRGGRELQGKTTRSMRWIVWSWRITMCLARRCQNMYLGSDKICTSKTGCERCLIIFFAVQSWIAINVLKAMDCYEQWFDILWSTMPYEPVESVEKGLFLRQWWPAESVSIQSDSPIWNMFQPWWLESWLGTSKLSSLTQALRTAARAAVENNANSAVQMLNVSPAVVMTTIIPWTLRRCAKTLDWHDEIWWAFKKDIEMDHIWTSWDLFDDFLQVCLLKTWLICPPQDSKEEAVTSCFDTKCRGCSGEQCQLCREDAKGECSSVGLTLQIHVFFITWLKVCQWYYGGFQCFLLLRHHCTMSFWCFCMFDSVGRVIPVTFP